MIGASLALALRKNAIAGEIRGSGRREENLKKAVERGIIDSYNLNHGKAAEGADLVVLATPVGLFTGIVEEIRPFLKQGAIVTDVGSCKGDLVARLEGLMPDDAVFVGGHPIAGADSSGIEMASAELFAGAKCIITPTEKTHKKAADLVRDMWSLIGADVAALTPEEHDRVFALVSHFTHIAAYALVNTVGAVNPGYIDYSGSGFRDTTRVALSSPDLWRDICMQNKEQIIGFADKFKEKLDDMVNALRADDPERLEALFRDAQDLRKRLK